MTGIELIAAERQEQIEKHGYTPEIDKANYVSEVPLLEAAIYCIDPTHADAPFGWDRNGEDAQYLRKKKTVERLAIAGAFIAAAIDRINSQK